MSVDPNPACSEGARPADAALAGGEKRAPEAGTGGHGEAIERELENWKAFIAGVDRDERLGAMVLVLHQDFEQYDRLRQSSKP